MSRLLLSAAVVLLVVGCDSMDPGPISNESISGVWRGEVPSTNVMGIIDTFRVELRLAEEATNVSGTGSVTGPGGAHACTILQGSSYLHPLVSLNLLFDQPPLGQLSGNVAQDRASIRGTMTGPGFSGVAELRFILNRVAPQ